MKRRWYDPGPLLLLSSKALYFVKFCLNVNVTCISRLPYPINMSGSSRPPVFTLLTMLRRWPV